MNWIEIDAILVSMMRAAKDEEELYRDAMKRFSWNRDQAESAIKPLQNRYGYNILSTVTVAEATKPKRQRKTTTKKAAKKK